MFQIAAMICGTDSVLKEQYHREILNQDLLLQGKKRFGSKLIRYLNALNNFRFSLEEALAICYGYSHFTANIGLFVNSRAQTQRLDVGELAGQSATTQRCTLILNNVKRLSGVANYGESQEFMILHALGAEVEQLNYLCRRTGIYPANMENYLNLYDPDNGGDNGGRDGSEEENLGMDSPRPEPGQQNRRNGAQNDRHNHGGNYQDNLNDSLNSVELQLDGQIRDPALDAVVFNNMMNGIPQVPPEPRIVRAVVFDPNDRGGLIRIKYFYHPDVYKIDSAIPHYDKEQEAASIAFDHMMATYFTYDNARRPFSSALMWKSVQLQTGYLPVGDELPSQQQIAIRALNYRYYQQELMQKQAAVNVNVALIISVDYINPRSYKPNWNFSSWWLQNFATYLRKFSSTGGNCMVGVDAFTLRKDLIASTLLMETIRLQTPMPTSSTVSFIPVAAASRVLFVPYVAAMMAATTFEEFYAYMDAEAEFTADDRRVPCLEIFNMLVTRYRNGDVFFDTCGHTPEQIRWCLQALRIVACYRGVQLTGCVLPQHSAIPQVVTGRGAHIIADEVLVNWTVIITPFHDWTTMNNVLAKVDSVTRVGQTMYFSYTNFAADSVDPVFTWAVPDTVLGQELRSISNRCGKVLTFLRPTNDSDREIVGIQNTPEMLFANGQVLQDEFRYSHCNNSAHQAFNVAAHYYPEVYQWANRSQQAPVQMSVNSQLDINNSLNWMFNGSYEYGVQSYAKFWNLTVMPQNSDEIIQSRNPIITSYGDESIYYQTVNYQTATRTRGRFFPMSYAAQLFAHRVQTNALNTNQGMADAFKQFCDGLTPDTSLKLAKAQMQRAIFYANLPLGNNMAPYYQDSFQNAAMFVWRHFSSPGSQIIARYNPAYILNDFDDGPVSNLLEVPCATANRDVTQWLQWDQHVNVTFNIFALRNEGAYMPVVALSPNTAPVVDAYQIPRVLRRGITWTITRDYSRKQQFLSLSTDAVTDARVEPMPQPDGPSFETAMNKEEQQQVDFKPDTGTPPGITVLVIDNNAD